MNDTAHAIHTIEPDDCTVESWPNYLGHQATIPVDVELPRDPVQACRREYNAEKADGHDVEFVDYLNDVIQFEPTFTVDGVEIDMETGSPVSD